ncbi:pilus assembly protein FimV [Rhodanobacter sp. TND4EL1]
MNRSLKLSVLIALALGTSQAMAMDLGKIQVKSALGQPLLAEIPLHPDNPAELQGLTVQLASSEEFARAGIVGGRTSIPLHFSVTKAGDSRSVIRITSSAPVDDPFLDLLIEVNGKAGKSVREYAILLDPPNAMSAAPIAASPAPARPVQHARPAAPAPVASEPKAATPTRTPAAPTSSGQLGPVERGQTLSGIARNVAPSGVDVQQMMLAIKQANPDAFYRDNINALKSGAVLRVPTSAEAQAMTMAAAAAEVRRQNSDWRAGAPGKPTVVADAATRTSSASVATPSDTGDRLALVPAKQDGHAGSPGTGSADKSAGSLRQDLLRTQESLASLQQQSSDLKTRLKDLGDINSKNERLLSLKDNEIAELQAKLAAARKSAGLPPAAESTVASAKEAGAETAATSAVSELAQKADVGAAPAHAGTAKEPVTPAAVAGASIPASAATTVTTPLAEPAVVKPAEPPVTKPAAKPVTRHPATTRAAVEEQPWYMQTWAWAAGAGALVLLILLAMLGRRRKPVATGPKSSQSLADRFGSTAGVAEQDSAGDDVDQEELLDQLAEHPDDIGLHLELVTLYYSRRDVDHFEAAAEAMHAHITDPQQDEWQDVLHMGEDLVPGHPLFDHHEEFIAHDDVDPRGEFDIDDYADKSQASPVHPSMPPLPGEAPKKVSEYNFNFDLTHPSAEASAHPEAAVENVAAVVPAAAAESDSDWNFDEAENFSHSADQGHDLGEFNDDPVDTKLDLARAYVDMGDADGARAMLGEVMNEGSQMQRDVAKRLLDSLH